MPNSSKNHRRPLINQETHKIFFHTLDQSRFLKRILGIMERVLGIGESDNLKKLFIDFFEIFYYINVMILVQLV